MKVADNQVFTMALASSRPRGETVEEDDSFTRELMQSAKERHEHQLVVNAVCRRLEPITSNLHVPEAPELLRLNYIQHLLTPIYGTLRA